MELFAAALALVLGFMVGMDFGITREMKRNLAREKLALEREKLAWEKARPKPTELSKRVRQPNDEEFAAIQARAEQLGLITTKAK